MIVRAELHGAQVDFEHIGVTRRDDLAERRPDPLVGKFAAIGEDLAEQDHVGEGGKAVFARKPGGGNADGFDVLAGDFTLDQRGIVVDRAAGNDRRLEAVERGKVHRDQHVGGRDDRRTDLVVAHDHRAGGGAAAHFGTVGREPGDLFVFDHSLVGDELPDEQDALSAEAREKVFRRAHCSSSFFCAERSL